MNSDQDLTHEELNCTAVLTPESPPKSTITWSEMGTTNNQVYMTPSVIKMVKKESNSDSSGQEEEQCESVVDDERKDNPILEEESTYEASRKDNHKLGNVVVNHAIGKMPNRKTSSTRHAWGNFSYADLITRAIMSSPDKRMTLQEIYAWISSNIPYFMDKKDGPTTTGWKNSVRHTLSIRKRFIRLPNIAFGSLNYKSLWTVDTYAEARRSHQASNSRRHPPESPRLEAASWNQQLRVWTAQPLDRATQTEFSSMWCPYCRHLVSLNFNTGSFTHDVSEFQN